MRPRVGITGVGGGETLVFLLGANINMWRCSFMCSPPKGACFFGFQNSFVHGYCRLPYQTFCLHRKNKVRHLGHCSLQVQPSGGVALCVALQPFGVALSQCTFMCTLLCRVVGVGCCEPHRCHSNPMGTCAWDISL